MELVVHERGAPATRFPLPEGATLVGRGEENGIVLTAAKVSGEHLVLKRRGATIVVEDLGSTNGTFMNGRRIHEETEVFGGDRLYLGDYVAWIEGELQPRPSPSGPMLESSEDELLMASSPIPVLAGTPDVFAQFGPSFRARFSHLVRGGLQAVDRGADVQTEAQLQVHVPPMALEGEDRQVHDAELCLSTALVAIRFVSNFSTDAMHEDWASVSFREGHLPVVLGPEGGRLGWREGRGAPGVPMTRAMIDGLNRKLSRDVGVADDYDQRGVFESFDAAGVHVRGACEPAGHQLASLDLRRLRDGAMGSIDRDSWTEILEDLVAPTRAALEDGGRILWCLRGPVPGSEAVNELLRGVRPLKRAVCVSDAGALGRGVLGVTSFARARIHGGDDGLAERLCGEFAAGCDTLITHLWRSGTAEADALKEALCGGCGGVLVTVWADSVEEGERKLAACVGQDLVPSKLDVAAFVRVNPDRTVTIDAVWDAAFVAGQGGDR